MDEWVKMENLDLTTVDISDSEGSDGKGCGCLGVSEHAATGCVCEDCW